MNTIRSNLSYNFLIFFYLGWQWKRFIRLFLFNFKFESFQILNKKTLHFSQIWNRIKDFYILYLLSDTGEDSKLVHRRKRPKVDASIFFFFPTRPSEEYDSAPSQN